MGPSLDPVDARDFRRTDLPFAVKTVKVLTRAEEVSSLVRKVMLVSLPRSPSGDDRRDALACMST